MSTRKQVVKIEDERDRPLTALTIEAALVLPSLRRGLPRVLAGASNLHRAIRWAHSSEVPNVATVLKGDELLLVTGMGIGRTSAQQRQFIQALVKHEVAGLVIELGQVYRKLPIALIQEAEAHELPLIELQRPVRFVDVTEEIHSSIVSRQLALVRRGAELHQRLTELMLDGADIPIILATLADTVGNPVLLEKDGYGVLYHAAHETSTPALLAAWELARDRGHNTVSYPVLSAGHQEWGHLVALPLESPLDDFDREAIERAVTLVALQLLRTREEALLIARQRGDFLTDIAAGRLDPDDAAATAQKLGFDYKRGALVPIAVSPAIPPTEATSHESEWVPVLRTLREELESRAIPALVGSAGSDGRAIVLIAISAPTQRKNAVDLCAQVVRAAASRHLGSGGAPVIVAGPTISSWDELPAGLRHTIETAVLPHLSGPTEWHDAAIPNVGRLLRAISEDDRMRQFVKQRIGPVLDHDDRRAAKLKPTLEALSAHAWRRADAARALGVARQSLYPQLRRIEELLGASLDDPDTRLGIEIALRARPEVG